MPAPDPDPRPPTPAPARPEPAGPPAAGAHRPPTLPLADPHERGITWRSLLIALVGILIIALYSDFNELIVQSGPPVAGNQLPILPMSIIALLSAVWNPLAGRLSSRLRLTTRELGTAMVLMLSVSWIAGYGMLRTFFIQLVQPWAEEPAHADWLKAGTLSNIPPQLVPLHHLRTDPAYPVVYGDFSSGVTNTGTHSFIHSLQLVPWRAWLEVMPSWIPLILLFALSMMALATLVHRQWSKHEQLGYPLATVFTAVLPGPGGTMPELLRSRVFWLGTLPPAIVLLNNWGSMITNGHYFPWISPYFSLDSDLGGIFPILHKIGYNGLSHFDFLLTGISYFLPMEVSFSIATGYMLFLLAAVPIFLVTGQPVPGPDSKNVVSGAFLAYALILLFTGRSYFLSVIGRACRRIAPDDPDPSGPWAARILVLAGTGFGCWLHWCFQMDGFVCLIYVLSMLLFFLVVMRVVCETGIPFFQSEIDIGLSMGNILGFPALGPRCMTMIYWLGSILNADNRAALAPFAANGLKVAENTGLHLRRLVPWVLGAVVFTLVLSMAAKLWTSYTYGASKDGFMWVAANMGNQGTAAIQQLTDNGQLEQSEAAHGLAKLALIPQNAGHGRDLTFVGLGALGISLFCLARYRLPWFPFHPLVFLMWETWPSKWMWFPFFIGWAMKRAIVGFGGARGYQLAKPFFLGLILGEVFLGGFFMVTQLIFYLVTGRGVSSGLHFG